MNCVGSLSLNTCHLTFVQKEAVLYHLKVHSHYREARRENTVWFCKKKMIYYKGVFFQNETELIFLVLSRYISVIWMGVVKIIYAYKWIYLEIKANTFFYSLSVLQRKYVFDFFQVYYAFFLLARVRLYKGSQAEVNAWIKELEAVHWSVQH